MPHSPTISRVTTVFLLCGLCGLCACGGSSSQAMSAPDSHAMGAPGEAVTVTETAPGVGAEPTVMSDRESVDENNYAKAAPAKAAPPAPPPQGQQPKPGPGSGLSVVEDGSRKQPILIYRAEFSLSVYEVQKSLDAVDSLAKRAGGYLSRRDDRSITIRVPAEEFQHVVDEINKVGDVLHRDVVSEDITAEFRDLEVQLQNLIALRSRFEKLLEKAGKVEEALAIEQQLGRVTGEIERIKGRLKLLSDQARYSTITVRFEARSNQQVQQGPFVLPLPWLNQVGLRRLMSL